VQQMAETRGSLGNSQLMGYPAWGKILTSHLGNLSERLICD